MGLIAFCGFVLPWLGIALWLYLTRTEPNRTGVPWRPLTDYVAPGDAGLGDAGPRAPAMGESPVTPLAGSATLTDPEGAKLH